MAIRIVDGVPGSGKTYWAVNHLVENYIKKGKEVYVITNIEGLLLDHFDVEKLILSKDLKSVFSVEFFKEIIEKQKDKQVLILIDEAQKYFHRKFFDNEVFYFFQYHRHLGLDIYLVTQNEKLLPIQLTSLAETVIHAQPRTTSLIGELKYVVKVAGESIDRQILRPSQAIFDLYSSMKKKEGERVSNPFKKYAIAALVLIVLSCFVFYFTFMTKGRGGAQASTVTGLENMKPGFTSKSTDQAPPSNKLKWVQTSYVVSPLGRFYVCPVDQCLKGLDSADRSLRVFKGLTMPQVFVGLNLDEFETYKKDLDLTNKKDLANIKSSTQNPAQ